MLHFNTTALFRRTTLLIRMLLLSAFILSLLACEGLPTGKPSTSAPRASDINESIARCSERRAAIDDWEAAEKRKAEEEWIDSNQSLIKLGAKGMRIQEEADDMRRTLSRNCSAAQTKMWESGN